MREVFGSEMKEGLNAESGVALLSRVRVERHPSSNFILDEQP